MKKVNLIASIACMAGGFLLGVSVLIARGNYNIFASKNAGREAYTYSASTNITKLNIEEASTGLRIEEGDVKTVTVKYSKDHDDEYEIIEKNGELSLIRHNQFHISFQFGPTEDLSTVVTVPKGTKLNADIKNQSGSIRMSLLSFDELNVNNQSGSIRIENVSAENASVRNSSGSITLENVTAQKVYAHGHSGSINLYGVKADSFDITNGSGSINLENIDASKSINLVNTSGGIRGSIVGAKEDFATIVNITSGSTNLENTRSGEKELNIKNTSGSVKIEFVKK